MKQLLQNLRSGETSVADVPLPQVRPGMALVRTAASLVSSGTERTLVEFAGKSLAAKAASRPDLVRQVLDKARREGPITALDAALNKLDSPMALGYSSAGVILTLGEGLRGFQVGDRVACAGGGHAVHAEYAVVPQNLLAHLPENVDFESGAFVTLGAIALHGLRLGEAQVGERVGVIGLGLLGLLSVELALAAGCTVFGVDLDPHRVELARKLGAEAILRPQAEAAAAAFSQGQGLDVLLICADAKSNDPVELAGALARDRARLVAVGATGLEVPRKVYYEKELSLRVSRSYGPGRYDPAYEEQGRDYPIGFVRWTEGRNLEAVAGLMARGLLDVHPLISHRFPIEQAPAAYRLITGKASQPSLGVLLTYPTNDLLPSPFGVAKHPRKGEGQGEGERPHWFQAGDSASPAFSASSITPAPPGGPTQVFRSPKERPAIGVLGAGSYASAVFLPAVKRTGGVRLAAIASASGVSAQHAAAKFGFERALGSEEAILADPAIDAVVLLTRHDQHARQALAALAAGKAVYCEKPLAITPQELDEIAAALAVPAHPLLMVGFNRRFAPLARQLKAFVDARREPLVAHYRVNAGYLPPSHWTQDPHTGGGRLVGEGCHFVDFLTFLAGACPTSVSARALPDSGRYCQDNLLLTLTFPDGSLGTLTYLANGDKSFPKERVEVFCGGRAAALDDFRSLELVAEGHRHVTRSRLRQDKGHQASWSAFLSALRQGSASPIPPAELLAVTRATFAGLESLRTGGREVRIDERDSRVENGE